VEDGSWLRAGENSQILAPVILDCAYGQVA